MEGSMDRYDHNRLEVRDSFGVVSAPMSASILNISVQGMAIQTPLNLKVNNRVSLNLRNGKTVSQLNANVVWSSLEGYRQQDEDNVPLYRAGLMFTNTINESGTMTMNFIHSSIGQSLQKRMFQRFKVERNDTIQIDMNIDFFVRKIGLEGMLIETRFPLEVDSRLLIQMSLGSSLIRVTGKATYVNQVLVRPGHETYHLGILFVDIDAKNRSVLEDYIINRKSETDS